MHVLQLGVFQFIRTFLDGFLFLPIVGSQVIYTVCVPDGGKVRFRRPDM